MPTQEEAKELANKLHRLGGGDVVARKAAARKLAQLDPTDATELIHQLLVLARGGWEPAACVLRYFVDALGMEASEIPFAARLKRLAMIQDLDSVAALFPEGPPKREMNLDAAKKADARLFSQALGYLKTRARLTRNPDELAKLAVASDPSVVRNVLINPRVTEDLVVRIAARRPARPEPLVEIWKSARWSVRPLVRKALAFNPYLPLEVGAKLVPLLSTPELEELAKDGGVHQTLREQAKKLLAAVAPRA